MHQRSIAIGVLGLALALALTVGQSVAWAADVEEHHATWIGGASVWSESTNWDPDEVPDNYEDEDEDVLHVYLVTISGAGALVDADSDFTIDTLSVLSGAWLDIVGGQLLVDRLNGLTNSGTISVFDQVLRTGGTLTNNGLIRLIDGSDLTFDSHPSQLSGGGVVRLVGDSAQLRTLGGSTLINASPHAIRGYGEILAKLENHGDVVANVTGEKLVLRGFAKTNDGDLSAEAGAILGIETLVTNSSGITQTTAGTIEVDGGAIQGGTVLVQDGLLLLIDGGEVDADVNLEGVMTEVYVMGSGNRLAGGVSLEGFLTIDPGAWLSVADALDNQGEVLIDGEGGTATLYAEGPYNITGDGPIIMQGDGAQIAGGAVTNNTTIEGEGLISTLLTNRGSLWANVPEESLRLEGGPKTNSGTITVDPDCELVVRCSLDANFSNLTQVNQGQLTIDDGGVFTAGSIQLVGATLLLDDGTRSNGSTTVNADSEVQAKSGTNELTGTVTNNGLIEVLEDANLRAAGTCTNNTEIDVAGSGAGGKYTASGNLSLRGTGMLTLGGAQAQLRSVGQALVQNSATHTIHGSGVISASLNNGGEILADVENETLRILSAQLTNTGSIRVVEDARMTIEGNVAGSSGPGIVVEPDGELAVIDYGAVNGGPVSLTDAKLDLEQGEMNAVAMNILGTSVVEVNGADNRLTGFLNNEATIEIKGNTVLQASGQWTNTGTIELESNGSTLSAIALEDGLGLSGAGALVLQDNGALIASAGPIFNEAMHTIRGYGQILTNVVNNGTVVADQSGSTLTLGGQAKSGAAGGVFRVENGGTLLVATNISGMADLDVVDGTVTVDGGTLSVNNVNLSASAEFEAMNDVTVGGNFSFAMTSEADLAISATKKLAMNGGVEAVPGDPATYATLEVGGLDLGDTPAVPPNGGDVVADPAGFSNNFALPRLTLGANAKVNLVDDIDNGNRAGGSEAIYVDVLTLGNNAILNLNGLSLYYNTLVLGTGAMLTDIPTTPTVPGDGDRDCDIDLDDYMMFANCLLGPVDELGLGCDVFDMDMDGDVDVHDTAAFTIVFSGEDVQVPGCGEE
jgi:hypothetical protein